MGYAQQHLKSTNVADAHTPVLLQVRPQVLLELTQLSEAS